jgi:hypothetical protein
MSIPDQIALVGDNRTDAGLILVADFLRFLILVSESHAGRYEGGLVNVTGRRRQVLNEFWEG